MAIQPAVMKNRKTASEKEATETAAAVEAVEVKAAPVESEKPVQKTPPSRQGKKAVTFFASPNEHALIKMLAMKEGMTLDAFLRYCVAEIVRELDPNGVHLKTDGTIPLTIQERQARNRTKS